MPASEMPKSMTSGSEGQGWVFTNRALSKKACSWCVSSGRFGSGLRPYQTLTDTGRPPTEDL